MEPEELLGDVKNIFCNLDFEGYQPEEISTMYPTVIELTRSFLDTCESKLNSLQTEKEKDILKTVVYNFFCLGLRVICNEFTEAQLDTAMDHIFTPLKSKFLQNPEQIEESLPVEEMAKASCENSERT